MKAEAFLIGLIRVKGLWKVMANVNPHLNDKLSSIIVSSIIPPVLINAFAALNCPKPLTFLIHAMCHNHVVDCRFLNLPYHQ